MGREVVLRVKRRREAAAPPHLALPVPPSKCRRISGPDHLASALQRLGVDDGPEAHTHFRLVDTFIELPDAACTQTLVHRVADLRANVSGSFSTSHPGEPLTGSVTLVASPQFPSNGSSDPMRRCFRVVDATHSPPESSATVGDEEMVYDVYCECPTPSSGVQAVRVEGFHYDWHKEYSDSSGEEESDEEAFSSEDDERERLLGCQAEAPSDSEEEGVLQALDPRPTDRSQLALYAYDSDRSDP